MAFELIQKRDYLNASLLAGDAIEITGTNVVHALSYPVTSMYDIPHRKALSSFLFKIAPYYSLEFPFDFEVNKTLNVNLELVVKEALTYPKIFTTIKPINKEILMRLLK